jgi:hypothetical protein
MKRSLPGRLQSTTPVTISMKKAVRDLGPDGLADGVPTDQGSVPSLRCGSPCTVVDGSPQPCRPFSTAERSSRLPETEQRSRYDSNSFTSGFGYVHGEMSFSAACSKNSSFPQEREG